MTGILARVPTLALATSAPAAAQPSFDYDRSLPLDVKETSRREQDGAVLRDITYATLDGKRNGATLVTPKAGGSAVNPVESPRTSRAAVLFVHWYGPPEPTSNRSQFVPDAIELVRLGVVSLLIDTPWSDPSTFRSASAKRITADRSRR